jgi:hypothetical protein
VLRYGALGTRHSFPYAGTIRIRFKGFQRLLSIGQLCGSSQLLRKRPQERPHGVGYGALRQGHARPRFCARYGGEEFGVLLPQAGLEGSFTVAENICNTISSQRLALKSTGKTLGLVTLSLGIAQFRPWEIPEELTPALMQARAEEHGEG